MAEDQNTQTAPAASIKLPYKILNATITTNDPLTASVLSAARSVKRLNAVLGMMLEAYLATPEGQFMAAQQLRKPVSELPLSATALAAETQAPEGPEQVLVGAKAKTKGPKGPGLNFDSLCS